MNFLYNTAIRLYGAAAQVVSLRSKKVRKMLRGQHHTNDILRRKLADKPGAIWFHASSLGEFEQGRPLIERLKREHPEKPVLLSFFSPSGYEVRKNYHLADCVVYLPFDAPHRVRKFIELARPSMAIFIKYEFWGNYLEELHRRGIPTYIISTIFRPGQRFFRRGGEMFRRMLHCFTHLYVQDERSRRLLKIIGIENVTVAGDTRFDRVYEIAQQAKRLPEIERFAADAPVFIAGSTWPPDEELLVGLIERYPDVKFIVAPHEIDPARIEKFCERISRPALRYTQLTPQSDLAAAGVLFVDTIGILSSVYRYGRWGYIGGGFGAGIHNTLEAATFGLPLAFGPRYGKFREARDLVTLRGAASIASAEELERWFAGLHDDPDATGRSGTICKEYVLQHKGATARIMDEICR